MQLVFSKQCHLLANANSASKLAWPPGASTHLDNIGVQFSLSDHEHLIQQLLATPVAGHRCNSETGSTHTAGQQLGRAILP
jgi:hypothetical protein